MSFNNKDCTYITKPTVEERQQISQIVLDEKKRKILNIISYATNIIIPLIVCGITKCNLIAIAISFILVDFILLKIDEQITIIKPHKKLLGCSIFETQQTFSEIKKQRDEMMHNWLHTPSSNTSGNIGKYLRSLDTFIKFENEWMEQKFNLIKEAEMKEDKRKSDEYENKREYFVVFKTKISYFINQYEMPFLQQVNESIDNLMQKLDTHSDGYNLVSTTMYIYMDELQNILNKMSGLDETRIKTYYFELERVAVALSQNIEHLISRIESAETEDIEIGISVLLKELTRDEMIEHA